MNLFRAKIDKANLETEIPDEQQNSYGKNRQYKEHQKEKDN
jgi:hypothetical protein